MKEIEEKHPKIVKTSFVLSFNPERLQLINEGKFNEVRDYWFTELEQLEKERMLALNTGNRGLYEEIWEKFCHALRMYDRYYVLADMKAKGKWIKRGW